jgi:hypothetical protein
MRHMQRAGRIGRHILNVDAVAHAHLRIAISEARLEAVAQPLTPEAVAQPQVDEAWPRHGTFDDIGTGLQSDEQRLGDVARLFARRLRQHHGGVGRNVAVRRIAGRLGRDSGEIERLRQLARRLHGLERGFDLANEMTVGVHGARYCLIEAVCHPARRVRRDATIY